MMSFKDIRGIRRAFLRRWHYAKRCARDYHGRKASLCVFEIALFGPNYNGVTRAEWWSDPANRKAWAEKHWPKPTVVAPLFSELKSREEEGA